MPLRLRDLVSHSQTLCTSPDHGTANSRPRPARKTRESDLHHHLRPHARRPSSPSSLRDHRGILKLEERVLDVGWTAVPDFDHVVVDVA